MAFSISKINNYVLEESHFVDGTHISKNSETILNTLAKFIYYGSLIGAIISIVVGVFAFLLFLISSATEGGEMIMLSFLYLLSSVLSAIVFYIIGVLIYSSIRVFCNISLSLKRLNEAPTLSQQPSRPAKSFCTECGTQLPAGAKSCPECGCPVD